jgi:cytochrome bd-type quinol oxidase subunit 2
MGDFLIDILLALAEIFGELLIQLLCEAIAAFVSHLAEGTEDSRTSNLVQAIVGYASVGLLAGGVSVLVFPHYLVPRSRFHGISLLISPFIAGSVMALVGAARRKQDKRTIPLETFAYAFVFAFAMAAMRFWFVK